MQGIHFTDDLLTGDEGIDNEHRLIFFLVNNMQGSVYGGSLDVALRTYVNILKTHAASHFAHEAEFMVVHDYADAEAHLQEHEKFAEAIQTLERKLDADDLTFEEVQAMVVDWLHTHIREVDLKMVQAIKAENPKSAA